MQEESSRKEYESILAAIDRVDDDFKNGKMPEDAYKQLRKNYMTKAAKMKVLMEYVDMEKKSPELTRLEVEKEKLKMAMNSLERELEKGEIDALVFNELKELFHKELSAITDKIEENE